MKVKDLISQLEKLNQEVDVALQKDSEGNGYSPLEGVDGDAIYEEESYYSWDCYSTKWKFDEAGFEDAEDWEAFKKKSPGCVILFPRN